MERYHIYAVSSVNDLRTAEELLNSIKSYRPPKGLTLKEDASFLKSVCKDLREDPFDEEAKERIKEAGYMIFICSPSSKGNSALEDRLLYFLDTHKKDRLITVISDGEPDEAFPEILREKKTVTHALPDGRTIERTEIIEPVAADLRGDTEKKRRQLLRYETVRIAALVLGLHPDELERRHEARKRRSLIRILSVLTAAVLIISGIFTWLGIRARNEGRTADMQTELTVRTAERTIKVLPELFKDDPDALPYIDEAVKKADDELEDLGISGLSDSPEEGSMP